MRKNNFTSRIIAFLALLALCTTGCKSMQSDDADETTPAKTVQGAIDDTVPVPGDYTASALMPDSLTYLGAFLLPGDGESEEDMFSYGGEAMCYNPANGSLFITGHNWFAAVAEITIPEPVMSKDLSKLNRAQVIQGFSDIKGDLFDSWTMEIPRAGLEVVGDKLFFCFGEHMEEDAQLGTHGYTDLSLSTAQKVCVVGDYLYSTNDYMFAIPEEYQNFFNGCDLMTGRFRDGGWSGMGPSLFAVSSQDIINSANNEKIEAVPVIKYDDSFDGDDGHKINDYSHADAWTGGAFITGGAGEAIIFVGTHGYGNTWYGFSNGVVYPTSGDEDEEVPEVPDYPHDERGWWNEDFRACIMLYDVSEAAKVYSGEIEPYEIQPYSFVDLSEYMLTERDETAMQYLGACAYDMAGGKLYVLELMADEGASAVHVFTLD